MDTDNFKIRYIIIEDEPLARRGLVKNLEEFNFMDCLGVYSNIEDAVLLLEKQKIDLIFLDIHLPEQSGLDFARLKPKDIQLIFTTAYSQYALESYEYNALDYLLKPISQERLSKAVYKALHFFQDKPLKAFVDQQISDHIFVKADKKLNRVELDSILYIEGLKDYVIIHTLQKKLVTLVNIKTILNQLPHDRFVRINKSYIISINKIESIDNHSVVIRGYEITLGAIYKEELISKVELLTIKK